jgi:hypothetical protein
MDTMRLIRMRLEWLRKEHRDAECIFTLMVKTTKPAELAKMREEKLGPLERGIADWEEFLLEGLDGTQEPQS